MNSYRILSAAEAEAGAAAEFYEASASGLGSEFLDVLQSTLERLCKHPASGRELTEGLRLIPMPVFPFNLIYSIVADELIVIAVAHQSRRPGYWDRRI